MYRFKLVFCFCFIAFLFLLTLFSPEVFAKKKKKKGVGKNRFRYDVIVMNRKSESRKKTDIRPVLFTHISHIKRQPCKVCHPKIFVKRKGANDINMQKNAEGAYCGKCHNGRFSFSLLECDVCHSGDPVADENAVRYAE